jgi:hypothetical protein
MTLLTAALVAAAVAASPAAHLSLSGGIEGKLRVEDDKGAVVVEVDKRPGAAVELALPPGAYSVHRTGPDCAESVASVTLEAGGRREVAAAEFTPVPGERAALGVFAHSETLRGAALGVVSTRVEGDARWLQASLAHNAAGALQGAQTSLGMNAAAGAVEGVQFSSVLNRAEGAVTGAQFALGVNLASGGLRGIQLGGAFNLASAASIGIQAGVGLNSAPAGLIGLQLAGANWAESVRGGQAGLFNVAGEATGIQLGAVNVAKRMTGFQFGLVNVADEASGAPFGLVSVIRDGQLHLEVFGSDLQPVNVALKSGSQRFFTTLMVGGGRTGHFLYGFGAGVHVGGSLLWLDTDLVSTTTLDVQRPLEHSNIGGHLRALGGLQLGPVGVFAGPTVNVLVPLRSDRIASGSYLAPFTQLGPVQLWPGLEAGVRL